MQTARIDKFGETQTKIGNDLVKASDVLTTEEYTFVAPKFDEGLKSLIEFLGGEKELYLAWYAQFRIEKQAVVRERMRKANGTSKAKSNGVLKELGL